MRATVPRSKSKSKRSSAVLGRNAHFDANRRQSIRSGFAGSASRASTLIDKMKKYGLNQLGPRRP